MIRPHKDYIFDFFEDMNIKVVDVDKATSSNTYGEISSKTQWICEAVSNTFEGQEINSILLGTIPQGLGKFLSVIDIIDYCVQNENKNTENILINALVEGDLQICVGRNPYYYHGSSSIVESKDMYYTWSQCGGVNGNFLSRYVGAESGRYRYYCIVLPFDYLDSF